MKILHKTALICTLALLFSVGCKEDKGHFARENDKISCDCTEQSIEQNLLCDGKWVADCSGADWITITPEQGFGSDANYTFFQLNIAYNSGAERTGVVHLIHEGKAYPISVTQGKCDFAYGTPRIEGNLFQNVENTATIALPYVCASGKESVEISCAISGKAAEGLSVPSNLHADFVKGAGELVIPIKGAALHAGAVVFELFAGGVSVGTCRANVISDPDALPEGLPIGWNFYAIKMAAADLFGSKYDSGWTSKGSATIAGQHAVLPSSGNENGYLTASAIFTAADYSFNPGIQIRGLKLNDYLLFTIPVKNIGPDTKLSVEASMGAAGSGPGYYALEYSADNKNWILADGSSSMTVFGATAQVHYYVPTENTSSDRKTYNKETDKGYKKYTFTLTGIDQIYEGNLYLRLRICLDRRANGSETTNTIAVAWADLKGFEVAMVEE